MAMSSNLLKSWGILVGLVVGVLVGIIFNEIGENSVTRWIDSNVFWPVGNIFLRSLFMIVVPLVFSSLTLGVANLGNTQTLKGLGGRVLLFYITTTFFAILIGQSLVNTVQPGVGAVNAEDRQAIIEQNKDRIASLKEKSSMVPKSLWPGIIESVIPKNILRQFTDFNMLSIIFVSILFGIGMMYLKDEKSQNVLRDGLAGVANISVMVVHWVMKIAPYAVAALVASAVFKFGSKVIFVIAQYMGLVIIGYLIQFFVVYGALLKYLVKISPREFYKRASPVFLTAFSTASSNGTMPVTIQTLQEKFGVPQRITSFSIPIGATFNMDGTALFEVIAALFIAQVYGVDLSITNHIVLVFLVLVTSIGVAGVPGGSRPILMMAMAAVGIPMEGIALILGVDHILDMGRTVVNVTGDTVAALFLAKRSGVDLNQNIKNIPAS